MVKLSHHTLRWIYLIIGWVALSLGVIGAFLPIMPTVPFLIVALWGFSKSSERFHHWLYTHKTYGPLLQDWDQHRVIPIWGKIWAVTAMTGSMLIMLYLEIPFYGLISAGIIMTSVGIYIVTRPSRKREKTT
ncbi:YbaN family protein [Curvivirga aplysinae]|uniref:YbaN family protein n=1 Tax=Curvivirga aplysinae TaxID=2529852 RepID=UPI0012BC08DB|nr:YbaN family protein [Curvivirga aplysinae]MTI11261.1 DUF454 domain-containing protein [Curvivirga aplysinae]